MPFSSFILHPSSFFPLIALLLSLVAASGCKKTSTEPDDTLAPLWKVPQFNLVDQDSQPFSNKQIEGKTWIALLFFSQCKGPCPMMSMRMEDIQNAVNNPDVKIVSISIDPKNDTPEKLKTYATAVKAVTGRWFFLTGKQDDIKKLADGLKLGFEPATADGQIMHSTKCLLIDKSGTIRGVYSTEDTDSMNQLKLDAPKISKE